MIISKDTKIVKKIEIDLNGPEGNAFAIIAMTKRLCEQLDYNYDIISTEMISGDYDNLVEVFDSYFGGLVIIYK